MEARRYWLVTFACCLALGIFGVLLAGKVGKMSVEPTLVEFTETLQRIDLQDGERLAFLGDSITAQCLYTQYVETYFFTRHPDRRIHFRNAGVGGIRASHAIGRFAADVAEFDPDYVTVLLGMNDAGYDRYNLGRFEDYQQNMETIMGLVDSTGAQTVLMHPTMFDARASQILGQDWEPVVSYYNGVLALYGAWLREIAVQRGLGFADMYTPLNRLTAEVRRENPTFTMIPDSMHPTPAGHVVMAVAMLDDLFVRSSVSSITIDPQAGGKRIVKAVNGKVTDVVDEGLGGKIQFNFMAKALPWVLPPEAAEGYRMTKAGHRYSGEKFAVRGLKPGRYALQIDGQLVGEYASTRLARGIELQENEKTPQYQQALKVALLNQKRNRGPVAALREWWMDLSGQDRELGRIIDASGADSEEAIRKAEEKAEFEREKFPRGVAETTAAAKALEDRIFKINQPVKRAYVLMPVKK